MRLTLLAATALLASTANETQAAIAPPAASLRNVALSTTPLPGVPAGVMVEQFTFPRIDRLGRVGFKARLIQGPGGVTADNNEAIFSEVASNDLRHVARSGEVVSGINFRFHDVEPGENLRMSGNGALYFISGMSPLASPSTFNSGIFRFTKQRGLELVVSSSPTGVPGVPSTGASSLSNFLDFNEAGDVTIGGTSINYVLPAGGALRPLSGVLPKINELGDVALRDGGDNWRLNVWNATTGTRTLGIEGAVAPGTSGAVFRNRWLALYDNAAGATVFTGRLTGVGVTDDNDYGVWAEQTPGAPVGLLIREGDQAPGVDAGIVWSDFHQFSELVSYGRGGGIAMRLGLTGPGVTDENKWGVWTGTADKGFHLVARAGDPAPGTEPGTVFDFFDQAGVTQDGRGVFHAFLIGPGLNPNHDRGIWAEGADGLLHLIVRRGDTTQLPNGQTVALSSVQFDPYFGVSELGEIAFVSTVAGNAQGVFVSSLVAVPEPGALAMSAAVALVWKRRGHCRSCE